MLIGLLIAGNLSGFGGIAAANEPGGYRHIGLTRDDYKARRKRLLEQIKAEATEQAAPLLAVLPAAETKQLMRAVARTWRELPERRAQDVPELDLQAVVERVQAIAAEAVAQWLAEQKRKRDEDDSIALVWLLAA